MPYAVTSKRNNRKARKRINIHQNEWKKGYVSTIANSRRPTNSLSDLYNAEIIQDFIGRPRPPLAAYGTQPSLPVIGRGKIKVSGTRSLLWMLNDSGVGKLYKQTDGGTFTSIGGTYDDEAWASCVQSKGKAYVFNGVDYLTYVTLASNTITTYTALTTPGAPSVAKTGMTGTETTHYYKITANNAVGESIASSSGSVTSSKRRDAWIDGTDYTTVTWSAVSGADSYTVYYGSTPTRCQELYTVDDGKLTFTDYGTIAVNTYKLAPEGNSTQGAVFTWMYNDAKNSQLFGLTSDNKLYYSSPGTGDFSPYNGGGWVAIDADGDTNLNFVDGFRNGKGDSVITVSARGAAGAGKLFHVTFETLTVGDTLIVYPNVYEANGQKGTYSARATIKARDALHYPTGTDFSTTGTSQNVMNILTTNNFSSGIEPDLDKLSLDNLHKAVGVEYKDRLYYSLPVGSTENNQIWYFDLARNLWVLRWEVAAKDLWLYEDSSGRTHFCALVGNRVLEFTRAGVQTHQDDGTAWRSRIAFESLVFDEDGIITGQIKNQYFKLLFPKGTIQANSTGYTRGGISTAAGTDTYVVTTTPTGYGAWDYTGYQYGEDPGVINTFGKAVTVLNTKPKGQLAQLDWEVVADTAGTDYYLSAVNTRGYANENLIIKR